MVSALEPTLASPNSGSSSADQGSTLDSAAPDESAHLEAEAGERVGRYELRARLGAGGMGVVHEAWDPELGRRVAIKLIRRGRAVSPELLRRRLRREAQAMARLRHPNVVAVYDVGESEGRLFVAMECVDGISLRKWLRAEPRSVAEILTVFRAAGEGLAAAHAHGVVHRDFKPENVLVAADGRVLVLDFGLASWATSGSEDSGEADGASLSEPHEVSPARPSGRSSGPSGLEDTSLTAPGSVLGTPSFMAPEQRRGGVVDTRSDQFGFCVALWQALSGELPYGRGGPAHTRAQPAKLRRKGVPKRVEQALRRGLAWSMDDRWPDMRALLDALSGSSRLRSWWLAIPAAATLALILLLWPDRNDAVEPGCEVQSQRIGRVWSESIATELAAALAKHGEVGRRSWPYLQAELERWIVGWTAVDLELCRLDQQGVVAEPYQRQVLCLDHQLDSFALAVSLLASASAEELERGFDLLAQLPDPEQCRAAGAQENQPGVDPLVLAEFEAELERAELEYGLGRFAQAELAGAKLLEATNGPGLEHLHVRAAELSSSVLANLERREQAIDAAFSGLAAAERDGAATLRLRAFSNLARIHVDTQDLLGAKRWLTQARTIAAERPLDRVLLRNLAAHAARVAMFEARFDEALVEFDRALELCESDADARERAGLLVLRAQVLSWKGEPERALEQFSEGERELGQIIGPEHPAVLELRLAKAGIMMKLDQFEPARAESLAAADSIEALRGQPTSTSLLARSRAASALDKLGDCAGARGEFDPLIPLAREYMPPLSPDLGEAFSTRAALCRWTTPEAVEFAREALALYREAVGDQHVMVAVARSQLARAYYEADELASAREEIDLALAIYAEVGPLAEQFVPDARALAMVTRHRLGEADALEGIAELRESLDEQSVWSQRLAELDSRAG